MSIKKLMLDDLEIKIVRKPIKNMYLRVRRNGEIEISAAPDVKLQTIENVYSGKKVVDFKKSGSEFKFID